MKKTILYLTFMTPVFGFCQEIPEIVTDRPDQTECTNTVPKGYFQMENGFTTIHSKNGDNVNLLPTSLWKIGINDKMELRMITEPQTIRKSEEGEFALPPIYFGFKTKLIEAKGAIPNVSFIAHLSIPQLSTDNLRENNFNPQFRFTMDNQLSKRFSIGYNLGMTWDDQNPSPIFQYTCALGYKITDRWKAYVELFGDKPQDEVFQLATSGGIYFYLRPNIMFDVTGAYGLVNGSLDYYSALGFSFLIPMKKKNGTVQ
jgi:hypothetical protein